MLHIILYNTIHVCSINQYCFTLICTTAVLQLLTSDKMRIHVLDERKIRLGFRQDGVNALFGAPPLGYVPPSQCFLAIATAAIEGSKGTCI